MLGTLLERDSLIARTSYPVVPPRVEYALTESGRALAERFINLCASPGVVYKRTESGS